MEMLLFSLMLGLGTYGLSDLIVNQDGPYNVFENIRNRFGVWLNDDGTKFVDQDQGYNLIGNILACQYCTSVWLLILMLILGIINSNLLIPFAAIGITTVLLDFKYRGN